MNGTLVSSSQNTYPYRSYIETTLNYGRDAKKSHLTSALYYRDGDPDLKGWKIRQEFVKGSPDVDMMGRLHMDFLHQDRFLINGVDVKLRLLPSKSSFNLTAEGEAPDFKSVITQSSLFIRRVKRNPMVQIAHAKALEKGNAKYL